MRGRILLVQTSGRLGVFENKNNHSNTSEVFWNRFNIGHKHEPAAMMSHRNIKKHQPLNATPQEFRIPPLFNSYERCESFTFRFRTAYTYSSNPYTVLLVYLFKNTRLTVMSAQVVQDGYEFFARRRLVTIFSAPFYCGQFDNAAAMLVVDGSLQCSFRIRRPVDHAWTKRTPRSKCHSIFLPFSNHQLTMAIP